MIGQFLNLIGRKAEEKFKAEELLNGLVIFDEAYWLAPRDRLNEDLEAVRTCLVDAVRTTRRFGFIRSPGSSGCV